MDSELYRGRLQEALSKALASRAPNVRQAYFDLATFYREKLHCGPDCSLCGWASLAAYRQGPIGQRTGN